MYYKTHCKKVTSDSFVSLVADDKACIVYENGGTRDRRNKKTNNKITAERQGKE
jgi:hypothetical protein